MGSPTVGGFDCYCVSGSVSLIRGSVFLQEFWSAIDAIVTFVLDSVSALQGYERTAVACRVNVNGVGKEVIFGTEVNDPVAATTVK